MSLYYRLTEADSGKDVASPKFIKVEELDSFTDFLVAFNLVATSFRVLV